MPLALIYWTGNKLEFCDMWAVRRELHFDSNLDLMPLNLGTRRLAESKAMFAQFQDQIAKVHMLSVLFGPFLRRSNVKTRRTER